jgi:hypothetical protein
MAPPAPPPLVVRLPPPPVVVKSPPPPVVVKSPPPPVVLPVVEDALLLLPVVLLRPAEPAEPPGVAVSSPPQ